MLFRSAGKAVTCCFETPIKYLLVFTSATNCSQTVQTLNLGELLMLCEKIPRTSRQHNSVVQLVLSRPNTHFSVNKACDPALSYSRPRAHDCVTCPLVSCSLCWLTIAGSLAYKTYVILDVFTPEKLIYRQYCQRGTYRIPEQVVQTKEPTVMLA